MITTLNRQNLLRFDAVPTKEQMRLAIAQALSLPSIYNSPVIVLDFEVGDDGKITGRFKDADRPRVFSFEILDDIRFSPFKPGRLDNEEGWEDFSLGYSFRFDTPGGAKKKPQCVKPTSYNCGKSCINIKKNCRCNPDDAQSKDRIDKLKSLAKDFKKGQEGGGKQKESKVSESKDKKLSYSNFESDFEDLYFEEKRKQELKGVVAIKRRQMLDIAEGKYNVPREQLEDYFEKLKDNKKIFSVMEKGEELLSWVGVQTPKKQGKQPKAKSSKTKDLVAGQKAIKEKQISYAKFEIDFKEFYNEEKRKQELQGVVAIKRNKLLDDYAKKNGISRQQLDSHFESLKTNGKVFSVKEKGEELFQWN